MTISDTFQREVSSEQILRAVAGIAPRLRELAPTTRAGGRLPDEAMALLRDAGVFRVNFPAAYGGPQMHYTDQLRLIEDLSRADGSVGWACMVLVDSGVYAGHFDRETAARLYPSMDVGTAASLVRPGRATKVGGGYRISGRYMFGTGSFNASMFACVAVDEAAAEPQRTLFFVPREQVTIHDTWDMIGLQGTGSTDYELDDVFVPGEHSYAFRLGVDESLPPLSRYHDHTLVNQIGVPLGVAGHILDEVRAGVTARMARDAGKNLYQYETGLPEAEAMLEAARASAYSFARDTDEIVFGDGEFTPAHLGRLPRVTAGVAQLCRRAVDHALELIGTDAVQASKPYEQLYQDFRVATTHVIFRRPFFAEATRRSAG